MWKCFDRSKYFTVETYHGAGIVLHPEEHETVQLRDDTKTFHKKTTGTLQELKQMYIIHGLKKNPYLETMVIPNNSS